MAADYQSGHAGRELERTMTTQTDPRVADIVRNRALRVGLFPSFFYTTSPVTGRLQGVGVEIAAVLAAKIGVELVLCEHRDPPHVVQSLQVGACDVAFLGIDPARATEVDFTPPYMKAEFSFLAPEESSIRSIAEMDRPGIRIAIVRNHAMEYALRGKLGQAKRIYAETPDAAFKLLQDGEADALAGIRPGLLKYAAQLHGSRVLDDCYGANILALAVAKGQPPRLDYLTEFVEHARTSGIVAGAIQRAGLNGIEVITD